MQQIINFFIRNKNFLLFAFLFLISLALTIQSHSYHKSKFIGSANFLTGGIYNTFDGIGQYFNLNSENQKLLEENNRLKSLLFNTNKALLPDSSLLEKYYLIPARVLKNNYASTNNFLTIDRGQRDSVISDLGVITSKGIVGIVDNASNKYARVLSILSTTSRVNAQLKKTDHFGILTWNGRQNDIVQLIDIPKQAPIIPGDTIVTGGRSTIFPQGIPIGEVIDFELDETANYYNVNIKLFNDMTNIGHVHVIMNADKKEIIQLEEEIDE